MTTIADVIEETFAVLRGYTRNQDQSTYLTAEFNDGDTSFTVAKGNRLSAQIVEIGSELIEVDEVDRVTGVVTVPGYGRGALGTTAEATYAAGSKVTSNPTWPRFRVKKAINDTLLSLGGLLFNVTSTTLTSDPTVLGYELPAGTSAVMNVKWRIPGVSRSWIPVRRWDVVMDADTDDFTSGLAINIEDAIPASSTISVTCGVDPSEFTAESDTLTDVGVGESARDVLVYGAVWRLLSGVDAARMATQTISGLELADQSQPQAYVNLTQQIWRVYQIRLQAEIAEQQRRLPGRVHWTRG